ncbi:hypothetical protein RHSIM_Rhsim09G0147600 [Rhododendron simsii]|uniref:Legume lectin domain-containing protein n=1 Tax=Rhododendron simsii TaxID=118357 RepID=A0A834GGM7_RHOSS|nr:hypothetical protein RHSIM_Rhsim09G0147600 [Rhododendron simsii]
MNCSIAIFLLLLLLKFATSSSSYNVPDDFTFNGCLKVEGRAELGSNGLFTLNGSAEGTIGHAFYSFPIQFKKSSNASVISFSTTFIFAIVPANGNYRGDGLAFDEEIHGSRAQLPDNLGDIIKSRDFGEASNEQDVQLPTSLMISDPFTFTSG